MNPLDAFIFGVPPFIFAMALGVVIGFLLTALLSK